MKLGLAGTGIEAFTRSTVRGKTQPVFFVPATINYLLTLEAETLIDDFLTEEGKARYIIEDDESAKVSRIAAFLNKLLGLDAACVVRFSAPLDCFGNLVDGDGVSRDPRGRAIDPASYVLDREDRPERDGAREAQYTRDLGEAICAAFKRDTVVMATHLAAAAAFDHLRRTMGHADLFALLRHADDVSVPRARLAADLDILLDRARTMEAEGALVLAPGLKRADGSLVLDQAVRAFAGYHTHEVLAPRGADLVLRDTRLLFYYQNRLAAHGLGFDAIASDQRHRAPGQARAADGARL